MDRVEGIHFFILIKFQPSNPIILAINFNFIYWQSRFEADRNLPDEFNSAVLVKKI